MFPGHQGRLTRRPYLVDRFCGMNPAAYTRATLRVGVFMVMQEDDGARHRWQKVKFNTAP
jgi:hypothetical protein